MGFKKRPSAPAGRNQEVEAWLESSGHPRAAEMRQIRDIILATDPRMGECIKWKTPTFTCGGNLASFNPQAKAHVSLMFHTGAKIPGRHPALQGGGDTARYMKFDGPDDIRKRRPALEAIVQAWCTWKAG